MRAHGFVLFGLTIRTYAMASLPHRYVYSMPAQSIAGRPLQFNLRDFGCPDLRSQAERYGAEKLLKLAILFSLAGLPRLRAEIILASMLDIDHALDLLCVRQLLAENGITYRELMNTFHENNLVRVPEPAT